MAEAFDTRELVEALKPERDADFFPLNDLPNDVLVSVFEAVKDQRWVRHTVPLVCKEWDELYRSKNASPLHETLEVHFFKEAYGAELVSTSQEGALRRPVVHASRVLSWAWRRAGWVRKLRLDAGYYSGNFKEFTAEDLGALVAVVGPSLTEISILDRLDVLCKGPFWRSLRTSVVPARRLRSFFVAGITTVLDESDVEPLAQLAGSLEELLLATELHHRLRKEGSGLPRFPASLFALTKLRQLVLVGHRQIKTIPAEISSLKKIEELNLRYCNLTSLPKELGELSGLTGLYLGANRNLGTALPAAEAFPAELKKMKSLRELHFSGCCLRTVPSFVFEQKSLEVLDLSGCFLSSLPKELGELSGLTELKLGWNENSMLGSLPEDEAFPAELKKLKSLRELHFSGCCLRTVPAFVGELKSLETLDLSHNNDLQVNAPLDFLLERCPRLRWVNLSKRGEWARKPLKHLEAFNAKMLAKYPDAKVLF